MDPWDASTRDRNPTDFASLVYLTQEPSSFSALVKEFFTYHFLYMHYRHEKSYIYIEECIFRIIIQASFVIDDGILFVYQF